jgi:bifunctional non-homologous end joining protein LigD
VSTFELAGRRIALTNLEKVLWPEAGRTKAWLLEYYMRVAPTLLAHLNHRPVTLRRFPDGIEGASWHQNECRGEPEWFRVFETVGRSGRSLRFCVVDDLPSLVWLANQAAIELHPFQWVLEAPRRPKALIFDLDPGPPANVVDCARIALRLRELLENFRLASYPKTSGSVGMHVHVPLGLPHDGEHVKAFVRAVADALAQQHPNEVVAAMEKRSRAGKVFVDWLQNDPTRQTVAPYSLRGMPFPTVAAPVAWEELERAVADDRPEALTFLGEDVLARLEHRGDLFADVLELEQALPF